MSSLRSPRASSLAVALLAALIVGLALPTPAATQSVELASVFRISLGNDGGQSTLNAYNPSFLHRPDSNWITFVSFDPATNLTRIRRHAILSNRTEDLLLKDGQPLTLNTDNAVMIAPNTGGSVIFSTLASNLPADLNPVTRDLFVYDAVAHDVRLITKGPPDAAGNATPPNGDSYNPALGVSQVAFDSYASNLAGPDTNGQRDVFVYSPQRGIVLVSITHDGSGSGDGGSYRPAISRSDRYVAFSSHASNLTATPTNSQQHIYVRDLQTGVTSLASVAHDGGLPSGRSDEAAISGDGRYIVFASAASNLLASPTAGRQIFLRDQQAGITELISVAMGGGHANGTSETPAISFDGRYVAYTSTASDLVAGDTNQLQDIFLFDRQTDKTVRVSVGPGGAQANDNVITPAISFDGRFVSFASAASNLVAGDTNNMQDIFVRDSGFLLERDGFGFENFRYQGATNDLAWSHFRATYHETTTQLSGTGARMEGASTFFENDYLTIGDGGNCFGMATISSSRFNKLGAFPGNPEAVTLPTELRSVWLAPHDLPAGLAPPAGQYEPVPVGHSPVKDYIHLYQARQLSYDFAIWYSQHYQDTAVQTYQAIRARLQARKAAGVLIFGAYGGHAMVATGVREQGESAYIDVYDNNYPDDASHAIRLNLRTGDWAYDLWPGATMSGSNRGLVWYDEAEVVTEAHMPGDCGSSYYHSRRCDDPIAAAVMVNVTGDTAPLVTDAQGRAVGYRDGRLVSEIPGGAVVPTFGYLPGSQVTQPTRIIVPAGGDYTVSVAAGDTGGGYTVTAYGAGSSLEVRDLTALPGKRDTITLRDGVLDATIVAAADGAYCHAVTREMAEDMSRDYESCVSGATGAPVRFALAPTGGTLTASNGGAAPVEVTVTNTQVGAGAGERSTELVLAPRSSTVLAFDPQLVYLPLVERQ